MKYRAEIDGLRSLAVVPVILFHAGFQIFSGGFVGVDIFFVISGYLITTIIRDDIVANKFSIIEFYERRARRILPALVFVIACVTPFCWMWLFPPDMKDYAQSIVAVSLFSSNILFWSESDYFGAASELKPLLHTWSLAVEEQYYIIFPPLMVFLWRKGGKVVLFSLLTIFAISLLAAQWGAYKHPDATFYLLPTRAWELLIGAICAIYYKQLSNYERFNKQVLSLLGLVLIITSIFILDESVPFPSVFALVPTMGTALIILFAQQDTISGKLLSNRILVGIGLVSYSAYLWHQPLFALARQRNLGDPGEGLFVLLIGVTFVAAYLTWRFVEAPFRNRNKISRNQVFAFSGLTLAALTGAGVLATLTDGLQFRFDRNPAYAEVQRRLAENRGLSPECDKRFTNNPKCRTAANPEILVWGDSFAMHLVPAILASNPDAKFVQATVSQCAPFLGVSATVSHYGVQNCIDSNNDVLAFASRTPSIKYVVLASMFLRFHDDKPVMDADGKFYTHGSEVSYRAFLKTAEELRKLGKQVIVMAPPPANGQDMGKCLLRHAVYEMDLSECNYPEAAIAADRKTAYSMINSAKALYRVVDLKSGVCEKSICRTADGDKMLFRDTGHLSIEGSEWLGRKIDIYRQIVS